MVKVSNRIGNPIVVRIKGEKVLVTAVKVENCHESPCNSCILREFKIVGDSQHPRNCQRVVPTCMAHKRRDNNSIIYKKLDHAD